MLTIHVTGKDIGTAILSEKIAQGGRRTVVPMYEAVVYTECGLRHIFGVTRDSSQRLFDLHPPIQELYGEWDECPPNVPLRPYHAIKVTHSGTKTFALRLFDQDSSHQDSLRGIGPVVRTGILIHVGDAVCSFGCLTVGGGLPELTRLRDFVNEHLGDDERAQVYLDTRHPDKTS